MSAPTPDVSSTLLRLIDVAERVVCARASGVNAELRELWPQMDSLRSPVGAPLSCAPRLLWRALIDATAARADQATAWRMVVGTLLPLVRDDFSRVIEARKQPLEQDRVRR